MLSWWSIQNNFSNSLNHSAGLLIYISNKCCFSLPAKQEVKIDFRFNLFKYQLFGKKTQPDMESFNSGLGSNCAMPAVQYVSFNFNGVCWTNMNAKPWEKLLKRVGLGIDGGLEKQNIPLWLSGLFGGKIHVPILALAAKIFVIIFSFFLISDMIVTWLNNSTGEAVQCFYPPALRLVGWLLA